MKEQGSVQVLNFGELGIDRRNKAAYSIIDIIERINKVGLAFC